MPIIHSPTSPSGRNGEQNLPGHQRNSSGSRNLLRHYCLYRRTFHQRTYSQHIQKRKKDKSRLFTDIHYKDAPWVTRTSRPFEITRGLEGRHIALWQSHGKYYINNKDKWGWQRPRLFCTSEDQFTQSFILPYLIPMLENAGANVFTPRERDTQNRKSL